MKLDPGPKPKAEESINSAEAPIGGNFELSDTNGNIITQKNLEGKLTLVYFGYGHCPDVCPATLHNITQGLNLLSSQELQDVQVFFISLDPERDTTEYLKKFISSFHPKIIALTGTVDQVDRVIKDYKVFVSKNSSNDNNKNDYLIDHSSLTYLMNREGKYLLNFSTSTTPEQIAAEIKNHLK